MAKDLARTEEEIKFGREFLSALLPVLGALLIDLLEVVDDGINVQRLHCLI